MPGLGNTLITEIYAVPGKKNSYIVNLFLGIRVLQVEEWNTYDFFHSIWKTSKLENDIKDIYVSM